MPRQKSQIKNGKIVPHLISNKKKMNPVVVGGVAAGVLAGALTVGSQVKSANLESRMATREKAVIEFRQQVPNGTKIIAQREWAAIADIYRLNPANKQHLGWIRTVNALAVKLKLPPHRIILTLAKSHTADTIQGAKTRKDFFRRRVDGYKRSKGDRKYVLQQIREGEREIERLSNVINILTAVKNYPSLAEFEKHVQTQGRTKRLKQEFGID